jgi:hypothetical protein
MARVMFLRLRRRADMFDADREHLHHFLLARGIPPHLAALIMIAASALAGGLALLAWHVGVPEMVLTYAFLGLLTAILWRAYVKERALRTAERA